MNEKAKWEINPDGFYPYCTSCCYEPYEETVSKGIKLHELKSCPHCGAEMDIAEWIKQEDKAESDNVISHPSHYTQGGIEPIDFITANKLDFCRGNAIKYIIRAGLKDGNSAEQDINKAIQYLQFYKDKVLR